jgi:microcystin-dependent protein
MPGGGSDPFVGQIAMVGFNFAPVGWAFCDGQLLSIAQNTVLFALLGTTYGGDGQTTFALPDLRGRVPIAFGQGPGLSLYQEGQSGGSQSPTLNVNELPAHTHQFNPSTSQGEQTTRYPMNSYPAFGGYYASTANAQPMGAATVAAVGGSQPHNNIQPFLGINFIISLFGVFPARS